MIALGQWSGGIADKSIPVQFGGDRGMEPVGSHQRAQTRAPRRQRSEKLTEGGSIHLEFRYAGAFSGNPQKFNVHGVPI